MTQPVLTPWDPTRYMQTPVDIAAHLDAAFEDGDPAVIAAVLGDIARAKGMTEVANSTGLGRTSLYKSLCADGHPELATVLKVVHALGLRLTTVPAVSAQ